MGMSEEARRAGATHIRRVRPDTVVNCRLCDQARGSMAVVVQIERGPREMWWHLCVPCARRIGCAAVGQRWKPA